MNYESAYPPLERLQIADSFGTRLKGLMFRRRIDAGFGLLLVDCPQIHTCFMRFPIDAAYLSEDFRVLHIDRSLLPWRVGSRVAGAKHVLELPAQTALFRIGDVVVRRIDRTSYKEAGNGAQEG